MDWFKFCKDYFDWKIATTDSLKIYVVKNKITADQFEEITGEDFIKVFTQ